MSEGTFEDDADKAEGQQAEGLATGAGPTESGGERQQDLEGTERGDDTPEIKTDGGA